MAETMEWTGRTVEAALDAAARTSAVRPRAWSTQCSSSLRAAFSA